MITHDTKYDLAGQVIGCAMAIHRELGAGFCESVYQNALIQELHLQSLSVEAEQKITVQYKNVIVGQFLADLLVENKLIVELKAVQNLIPTHEVQIVNYLTATGIDLGLLLNFGNSSLQFKKKHREYKPQQTAPNLQS